MKKLSKQKLIVIGVIAILVVLIFVLAIANSGSLADKKQLEKDAKFKVTCEGVTKTITMDEILALNPVDFKATMDTSTTSPTEVTFSGVEFSKIFEFCKFDLTNKSTVEVKSLDGYASALTIDEINQIGNVFLCIKKDGEPLLTKSENGFGPYLMVINSSAFSQRWCKFVEEIVVK